MQGKNESNFLFGRARVQTFIVKLRQQRRRREKMKSTD